MALTVEGCVSTLIEMGYVFNLREDGSVVVKQPVKRNPRATEMMSFLALHKDEVRRYVRSIQPEQMQFSGEALRLTGIPPDEAFALGEAIKRGEALLVGKVIYHLPTGLFDITFIPMEGSEKHERKEEREPRRA
jgi:hypothetical protein